jgi:hypothetical protein
MLSSELKELDIGHMAVNREMTMNQANLLTARSWNLSEQMNPVIMQTWSIYAIETALSQLSLPPF